MAELADAPDLGSGGAILVGSSPSPGSCSDTLISCGERKSWRQRTPGRASVKLHPELRGSLGLLRLSLTVDSVRRNPEETRSTITARQLPAALNPDPAGIVSAGNRTRFAVSEEDEGS